jgi:hypothetical protein
VWLDVATLLAQAGKSEEAAIAMRRSLKRGISDKAQWITYAKLAKAGVFSAKETADAVDEFAEALKPYPHLAVDAFEQLISVLDKEDEKGILRVIGRMASRFPENVGATGRVWRVHGRYLEMLGREKEAQELYARAAPDAIKCRAVGLDLLDNAARLMIKRGKLKDAIALHEDVFYKTKPLANSAYVIFFTRFAVGVRLAKLHEAANDEKARDMILKNICSKYAMGSKAREELYERIVAQSYDRINRTQSPLRE